jgi:CheY-like chemotaxis protein
MTQRPLSLLIVDDQPGLLEIAKLFLEKEGKFRVETAGNGRDALRLIGNRPYDVVVSDMYLPDLDGVELLRAVRRQTEGIAFILFSGKPGEDMALKAINEGADGFLVKRGEPRAHFSEIADTAVRAVRKRMAPSAEEIYKALGWEGGVPDNREELLWGLRALAESNRRIHRLDSKIRHSVLNHLTVILGYLDIAADEIADHPDVSKLLHQIDAAAKAVNTGMVFSRNYMTMGTRPPLWQDLPTLFHRISDVLGAPVLLKYPSAAVSVYSDPLLELALRYLVERAAAGDPNAARVTVSYPSGAGVLRIQIQGPGPGFPHEIKEAVFDFNPADPGLFLAQAILSLTGIEAMESGSFPEEVRFELQVPPGMFRIGGGQT